MKPLTTGALQRAAGLPSALLAAPRARRCHTRRLCVARATGSFEELRTSATDAVAAAQAKLPALEQARTTAAQMREPAADAERHWQECHARLTSLQQEASSAMKQLREGVTKAAGGEEVATHDLLERHVYERLQYYRVEHNLVAAEDWKVYKPRDLPLHSIPGGKMLYQVAAAEVDGVKYAVVGMGMSNPFLFDNLRSMLVHWGCSEGANAGWMQPPKGWHTSPGVSTPAGSLAWETLFGAYAPVMQGEAVVDAAVYSVVLQIPLEGALELRGGVKCVLKRTDGGQPEWVKAGAHNSNDFFLDLQPVIHHFERKRRVVQAAAFAQARAAAVAAGEEEEEEEEKAAGSSLKDKAWEQDEWGAAARSAAKLQAAAERKSRTSRSSRIPVAKAVPKPAPKPKPKAEELPPLPPEEPVYDPQLPEWVLFGVEQFVQLSDLPQERGLQQHLKCYTHLATAMAEAGGESMLEARVLLQRCGEVEAVLHQHELAELSARAAQQEKEQLQALYKSASDESSHLMQELSGSAEAARRAAVRLRGRETEVTQRDLEAVAEQTARELLKKSQTGIWPFKEDKQLVFVQQKVMEVAGMDAAVVVQVFVEGTKAAVQAATAGTGNTNGNGKSTNGNESIDAAMVASSLATTGQDTTAAASMLAAAAGAAEAVAASATGKKAKEPKPQPTFDHVVVGISVAEEFPDGRLKTPLIMHMGLVAHQHAKWRIPPEKWSCAPDAVSSTGAAAQMPFQRFRIASEHGGAVFVDPTLFSLAFRLPLKDCMERGIRGVEFVLKNHDGQWLSWQQSHSASNFYAELPLPLP